LTKATYDAVGNKFRSLWGKEAGWAHSVLFTADLRAFAERLVVKKEVKEEVKEEDDTVVKVEEDGTSEVKMLVKKVKREAEEEKTLIEVTENVVRKNKRRKKA